MLEALLAIVFLVPMLAALIAMFELYSLRLHTLGQARRAVWAHALSGCQSQLAETVRDSEASSPLPPTRDLLRRYLMAAHGSHLVGTPREASVTIRRRRPDSAWAAGLSSELVVGASLACNERARRGQLAGALRHGWEQVRFW
jgi:hypothetical protein